MTVEEIFQDLANHMKKGVAFHQELINYYDFLHLCGYKKCHEYHYYEEQQGYRNLYHYFVKHYNKLIETQDIIKKIKVIPGLWYKHKREDIDIQMKRQAVETGIQSWIKWEKETKKFYQKKFQELMQLGEVAAAMFLKDYVCDVDKELECAEDKYLDLKAANYDIVMILDNQKCEHKKYKKKLGGK